MNKKTDLLVSLPIWILTLIFISLMFNNQKFFDWAFERHQNQWSWYLRPIFLIPFCISAYKQSHIGMALSIFSLFTSMFWFPKPQIVSEEVIQFLEFEKTYLLGEWTLKKIITQASVPISFSLLAISFWRKSLKAGILVIMIIALSKITWSIAEAGESGKSILIPAIAGLIICTVIILMILRRTSKTQTK